MPYKEETPWWVDAIVAFSIPVGLIACALYLFMLAITDWWM